MQQYPAATFIQHLNPVKKRGLRLTAPFICTFFALLLKSWYRDFCMDRLLENWKNAAGSHLPAVKCTLLPPVFNRAGRIPPD